jgi:hypothetical protein
MKKYRNLISAGLGIVGVYFVYKYFSQSKKQSTTSTQPSEPLPEQSVTNVFPLKKGSRGSNVKAVQTIILKIDKSLLPKFGADGDFGSETESAIFKLLGKKTIDGQSDINKLNDILNKKLFPYVTKQDETKTKLPPFGIKLF